MDKATLLRISKLEKRFGKTLAVENFSLDIVSGEVMGLVGESGSGKTTVGRCIVRLIKADQGVIEFDGTAIDQVKHLPRQVQMIFQDPYASLNPRMTVRDIVGEPLEIHRLAKGPDKEARVAELLKQVGLEPEHMSRFPHEFSGGQRQRIGIARALAVQPRFLVCDEALSALDVSVQAQIVRLLKRLRQELGLTYLFIAHDLAMMGHLADRMAVMYQGTIVELAPSALLYQAPHHPYTQALLSAIPIPDPQLAKSTTRIRMNGEIPTTRPTGCIFHGRCPKALAICRKEVPQPREVQRRHITACHLYEK